VLNRYVPPDHTRNIPVLREVYDPTTKSGRTVKEIVGESPSLSQKAKFPKRGQGKPLRIGKSRGEKTPHPIVCEILDPDTSHVVRYVPVTSGTEKSAIVPELPKYVQPKCLPTYVPPDHGTVPVIREVADAERRLPRYVPPDHVNRVPVIREVMGGGVGEGMGVDTGGGKEGGRLPKYVPPDHVNHVPVIKEVFDVDKAHT